MGMNAFFEYTLGAAVRVADTMLRLLPVPVTAKPLHRLEESANAVRRLRLLGKHHPDLLEHARRVPVKCYSPESFGAKFKRVPYDSRGLLLFTDEGVLFWDLGQSTRLEPFTYRRGDASVSLHLKEPYRQGEHAWVQMTGDGVSRYFQRDQAGQVNEATRALFDEIEAALQMPAGSD